jgi:PEP-CTERM motif-containing protein
MLETMLKVMPEPGVIALIFLGLALLFLAWRVRRAARAPRPDEDARVWSSTRCYFSVHRD